ncbi:5'-nucleotidase C-terminal domain-containing protein [Flavobacterium sp.]|uniref:5'-nucleotidase C-terminal domain-containing protein n=1 Tax=Flavobacterium sp. TaxID=239 RepID=UPI0026264B65|nr:5'-nucleotidase [Flavobacterium sp.]
MVNLKNYSIALKHFGLLLTFLLIVSCNQQKFAVSKIEGKKIGITSEYSETSEIENFIKPYKEYIDKDLSSVLAYCPVTLDKSKGEWQTNIGNFIADITFEKCESVFNSRTQKHIDFCILNNGGIRSVIPMGNVTSKTAYEVMPFENSATVVELKGEQVLEMINYFITEKKPHPLSRIQFTITKNNLPKDILIQEKPLDNSKSYFIVTNDYLANGGDNMTFFKKAISRTDLDYKLRNVIIDNFKEVDTLKINTDKRIIKEN